MICSNCKREIGDASTCPYCGFDNGVSVMTEREKDNYSGVTIEEENNRQHSHARPHYRQYHIWNISSKNSWLSRFTIGLIILAAMAFMIFVALPFLSIALLSIFIVWVIFKILH
ncbi:hypothetical protein [Pectinatus frisingensis]|uniref:hypothetical protein n=1 Tax=Pectinatus frisingensis TaxID=865 RepID=UPI0015F6FD0A|nr:hypothetical protein [Pectinatus frisingensis]